MYGLAMIEVMTLSGHLSNIDEIPILSITQQYFLSFFYKAIDLSLF